MENKPKKQKVKAEVGSRMDKHGNSIIASKKDNIITVYLKLKSETKKRNIGFINTNTKVFYTERKRGIHFFRKLQAYGFCYQLIKDTKHFDAIRLKDEYEEWLIPRDFILENPTFLHFVGSGGYELQVFIPVDKIEEFKRENRF